jgi:hypothetical protein
VLAVCQEEGVEPDGARAVVVEAAEMVVLAEVLAEDLLLLEEDVGEHNPAEGAAEDLLEEEEVLPLVLVASKVTVIPSDSSRNT